MSWPESTILCERERHLDPEHDDAARYVVRVRLLRSRRGYRAEVRSFRVDHDGQERPGAGILLQGDELGDVAEALRVGIDTIRRERAEVRAPGVPRGTTEPRPGPRVRRSVRTGACMLGGGTLASVVEGES